MKSATKRNFLKTILYFLSTQVKLCCSYHFVNCKELGISLYKMITSECMHLAILSLIANKCINWFGIIYRNFKKLVGLLNYNIQNDQSYQNYLLIANIIGCKQKHTCNCILSFKRYTYNSILFPHFSLIY